MENKNYKVTIKKSLDIIFPILGLFMLGAIYKFTRMHINFFPEDIPISNLEIKLLLMSLVLFIISMYYKIKVSTIIFFICIVWSLVNIGGYMITAALYYRGLYIDKFI